jgi:DNA (cytosine-5)-methyltransferase 1
MFSGIGGAELALPEAEWLWCAEIEAFPSDVLAQRFGHANLGDVLAPDFIDRAKALGPLDLLCGGPPCQAFSVAGNRLSMADPRGNLSLRFVQVAHAIRPRNLLVENVPGWLNTPDNAFGCFLGAIVGGDGPIACPTDGSWPRSGMVAGPAGKVAWRVLDAQYAGLAQRRERVFAVVDFGEGADPAAVLFEPKGLLGDSPPRREAGEGVTGTLSAGTDGGGGLGTDFECQGGLTPETHCHDVAPTLDTTLADKQGLDDQHVNGGGGWFIATHQHVLERGGNGKARRRKRDADSRQQVRLR